MTLTENPSVYSLLNFPRLLSSSVRLFTEVLYSEDDLRVGLRAAHRATQCTSRFSCGQDPPLVDPTSRFCWSMASKLRGDAAQQPTSFRRTAHVGTRTGEKQLECAVCQKKFGYPSHLEIHLRTHTGEKPFECTVCLKKFYNASHLRNHVRIHTGEKPFECILSEKV
ncbi:zinc finger protein 77-like isoform X2 [Thrips palmi]|uniref:Zinc finger protein 77-like isoform X2 n=1 Tax=Thrips palmi TaxID=161013 RepID=A0A6P8YRR3_THRPL|nr:zinc finger protein 77-like isoform X2 [Thrips palmi]